MKKNISVIIVTYNSESLIYDCLDSLIKYNDIGDALEIIVVDNKSNNVDAMFSLINEKYASKIILMKNDKNGGYGQGNNVGVQVATSPLVMIMNPDVRIVSSIFHKIINHFSDPKLVMLGMLQKISNKKKGLSFSVKLNSSCIISILETVLCNKFNYYNSSRMCIAGACFVIDKSVFEEIGLFDENIFMYGEENDLHHRITTLKPNHKIVFDKNISYLHLLENRPLSIKTWLQMLDSNLYFCKKNGLSEKRIIQNSIITAKFFKLIAFIKSNKNAVIKYTEWIDLLYKYKKICTQK